MAEAEDVITDAALHATNFVQGVWRRHRANAPATSVLTLADIAQRLDLLDTADVTVLHVLDTPEKSMMQRSLMSGDEIEDYELAAKAEAVDAMHGFLEATALRPVAQIITPVELSIAETIRSEVREARPDLLIVGTQGRSGIEKFFLGSVAEELLKLSDVDVLAAPAPPKA